MSQVIIGDILPYTQATAILNQTVFGTNWTANVASDVVVYQTPSGDSPDDATQILAYPADYSVDFIGDQEQVQVTLVTPAGAGDIITIIRDTPADRMNLYSNTNFTPSMLNNDFGILTLVDQQAQLVNQLIGPRYNYSAVITDVVDTILPILGANQIWGMNSNNTAIIAIDIPASGFAPANATYVTATNQVSVLPNSFQLLGGANVTLTTGTNTLTISVTGESINPGLINQLAYYAANGSVISGLATANNGVLVTSAGGVPSISSTLPSAVQTNITELGTITTGVWNGTNIDLSHGGTNASLTASDGGIVYSTATAMEILAGTATANLPLLSGSSVAPSWGAFALSLGGALTTGGAFTMSGAFAFTGTLTNTTSVTFPTSGTLATTSELPTPAALTKTDDTNVTLTLGGTPATALLQATSLTLGWTGQLSVARGGTGVGSVTIAPTASAWAGWDANKNFSANLFISGYTTTPTAASTTTLTVGSTQQQYFTGTTTQTLVMPVANTLVVGQSWHVVNNSTGIVTIQSSGGNTILALAASSETDVTCITASGTSASSWTTSPAVSGSGTVNSGTINQLAWYAASGTIVSGLPTANNGVLITSSGGVPSISSTLPSAVITNIPGRYLGTTIYTSGTNTFTPNPAGNNYVVTVISGGGGGGGVAGGGGGTAGAGGGGSGGVAQAILTKAQMIGAGTTTQAVVGALGAGGTAGANTGSTGGTSTLIDNGGAGSTLISCTGGVGGLGGTVSVTGQLIAGGAAGGVTISTGTQISITGQGGFNGLSLGTVASGQTGRGGSTPYGGGGGGGTSTGGAGIGGGGMGTGGGGAFSSTASNFAGGNGTAGLIRIDEYS